MSRTGYTTSTTRLSAVVVAITVGSWLIAPMLVAVPMSFTGVESFVFPPPRWSTRWYAELVGDPAWRRSMLNSARIGVMVIVIALPLGTAAALALHQLRPRLRLLAWGVVMFPLVVPVVVLATGLYLAYLRWQLLDQFWGIVLAHVVLVVPAVTVTVTVTLQGLDRQLERAAASLGAGPWRTFGQVTLPLIAPGIAGGAVFAAIGSLDETVVTQFVGGPRTRTLPVQVFYSMTQEIDPTVAAAATVNLASTWVVLVLTLLVMTRRTRSGRTDPGATGAGHTSSRGSPGEDRDERGPHEPDHQAGGLAQARTAGLRRARRLDADRLRR